MWFVSFIHHSLNITFNQLAIALYASFTSANGYNVDQYVSPLSSLSVRDCGVVLFPEGCLAGSDRQWTTRGTRGDGPSVYYKSLGTLSELLRGVTAGPGSREAHRLRWALLL